MSCGLGSFGRQLKQCSPLRWIHQLRYSYCPTSTHLGFRSATAGDHYQHLQSCDLIFFLLQVIASSAFYWPCPFPRPIGDTQESEVKLLKHILKPKNQTQGRPQNPSQVQRPRWRKLLRKDEGVRSHGIASVSIPLCV